MRRFEFKKCCIVGMNVFASLSILAIFTLAMSPTNNFKTKPIKTITSNFTEHDANSLKIKSGNYGKIRTEVIRQLKEDIDFFHISKDKYDINYVPGYFNYRKYNLKQNDTILINSVEYVTDNYDGYNITVDSFYLTNTSCPLEIYKFTEDRTTPYEIQQFANCEKFHMRKFNFLYKNSVLSVFYKGDEAYLTIRVFDKNTNNVILKYVNDFDTDHHKPNKICVKMSPETSDAKIGLCSHMDGFVVNLGVLSKNHTATKIIE